MKDLEEYNHYININILTKTITNKEYQNYEELIKQIELVLNGEVSEFTSLRNSIKPDLINIRNYLEKDMITFLDYTTFSDSLI